ncbi:MAG: hypothetical protein ACI8PZ_004109 [Myxococcota bacterium]|jgi:hypothetical protein
MLRFILLSLLPTTALAQDAVFVGKTAAPSAEVAVIGKIIDGVIEVTIDGRDLQIATSRVEDRGAMRTWTAAADGVVLTLAVTAKKGREPALDLKVLSEAWLTVDVAGNEGAVQRTSVRLDQLRPQHMRHTTVAYDDFDAPIDDEPFEFETAPAAVGNR